MLALKSLGCLGGLATALLLLAPSDAQACSCFPVLEVGQVRELPVNGDLLVLESCGAALEDVTATVDGELVSLSGAPGRETGAFAVAISPAPEVGQLVEIERSDPELGTDTPAVSLTVVEADTTAPVLADLVVKLSEPIPGDSCNDGQDALGVLSVTVDETTLDDGARFEFLITGDGNLLAEGAAGRFYLQPDNTAASYSTLVRAEVAEICVEVTAIDAAGNRSETLEDCMEGTVTDADADDDASSGCGCRADRGSPAHKWGALVVFGLLGGLGLRSRRRVLARNAR